MKVFALLVAAAVAQTCTDNPKKPGFCTDVTKWMWKTNSWVCKNCFNIRINFNLKWLGPVGGWFTAEDYVWFAFNREVSVIKWAGPVTGVTPDGQDEKGNYRFKVAFEPQAQFGDGRIDVNIEFNDLRGEQKENGEAEKSKGWVMWGKLCPCGQTKTDSCDASLIKQQGKGGFWDCGYMHRAGDFEDETALRMNKCYFRCHGNPDDVLDQSENWFTGAKGRCFRQNGRKYRPGYKGKGVRKFRELFKWELGKTSNDKLDCTSGKGLKAKNKGITPQAGSNNGGGKNKSRRFYGGY